MDRARPDGQGWSRPQSLDYGSPSSAGNQLVSPSGAFLVLTARAPGELYRTSLRPEETCRRAP